MESSPINKRKSIQQEFEDLENVSKKSKPSSIESNVSSEIATLNEGDDIQIRKLLKEWTSDNSNEYQILLNYYVEILNNSNSITIFEWYKHLISANFIKYLIKHDPFKEIYQYYKNLNLTECNYIYKLSRFNQICTTIEWKNCLLFIKKFNLGSIKRSKTHYYIEFSTRLMKYFLIYITSHKMGAEKYNLLLYKEGELNVDTAFYDFKFTHRLIHMMNNSLLFSHFNTKCFDTNLDKITKIEYLILPSFEKLLHTIFTNSITVNHTNDNISEIILNGINYKIQHLFKISKEAEINWDLEPGCNIYEGKTEFVEEIEQERDELTFIWIIRNYLTPPAFIPIIPKYSNVVVIYLDISSWCVETITNYGKESYSHSFYSLQFVKSEGQLHLSNNLILNKENIKYYSNHEVYNLIHDVNGMNISTDCIEFDNVTGIELNLIIEKFTKLRCFKRVEKMDLLKKAIKLLQSKFPKLVENDNRRDLFKFVDFLFENFTQLEII